MKYWRKYQNIIKPCFRTRMRRSCWTEDASFLFIWRHGKHCFKNGIHWPA